jgi:hypothetical protein
LRHLFGCTLGWFDMQRPCGRRSRSDEELGAKVRESFVAADVFYYIECF